MKAFTINPKSRVFVYKTPVSMSYSFPGLRKLAATVQEKTEDDVFLFVNKKSTYLKILFHAKDGWCIFSKRLDAGKEFSETLPKLDLKTMQHYVDEVVEHGGKKLRRLKAA